LNVNSGSSYKHRGVQAMVRNTERHPSVRIIFEDFEDIAPELQDRIWETLLAALAWR
jgi:hypothetical protein